MRDYGRVHGTFWSSPATADMSDRAKLLALYLMTCTHGTIAGVFRLPEGYIAEDLRWETEEVREVFSELLDKGFANRCETTKWVWIIKHLEWNRPENPNQRKAAVKVASGVPSDCGWIGAFTRAWGELLGLHIEQFVKPLSNPCATLSQSVSVAATETVTETIAEAAIGAAEAPTTTRGTRLPEEWILPIAWGEWALTEPGGWTVEAITTESLKFHDFWVAKAGKDATKLDWMATWRNWVRNARLPAAGRAARSYMSDAERNVANELSDAEAKRLLFGNKTAGTVINA